MLLSPMHGEISRWRTPGQCVLYSCLQLFLKLKMFNPLAHKKVEERLMETSSLRSGLKVQIPGTHLSLSTGGAASPASAMDLGMGSGSLVKAKLPGHGGRHSQLTGLKDTVRNAVGFGVLWSEGTCSVQSVSRERAKG